MDWSGTSVWTGQVPHGMDWSVTSVGTGQVSQYGLV